MNRAALLLGTFAFALAGCGGGTSNDGGTTDAGFTTAPHQPFPSVSYFDGGILAHPQLVTMTYPLYAHVPDVQGWGDYVGTSQWMQSTGAEYGVGTGTHLAKVVLPDPIPAQLTDAIIRQDIQRYVTQGVVPPSPAGAGNQVVYLLYLAASTAMNDPDAGLGVLCTDFVGYHDNISLGGGSNLFYAVVGDCDSPDAGQTTILGDIESAAAHELMETATDPTSNSWYLDVPSTNNWWEPWEYAEVGDLCELTSAVAEGPWFFQRMWSNRAAAAGGDPCIPAAADGGYWNVTPNPGQVQVVAPGSSVQIVLSGWSTQPVSSWPLTVGADYFGDDFDPVAQLSATTLNNGQTATLTLSVPVATGSGLFGTVFVYSDAAQTVSWPITLSTP